MPVAGSVHFSFGRLAPSWIRVTIALTPFFFSLGTSALAVSTSSLKVRPLTPSAVTMSGVPSRVIPMKPILTPSTSLIAYAGRIVLPLASSVTLAARMSKSAPAYSWAAQEFWLSWPSPSAMQPPSAMRWSSW